jgi:hypothetical protein
VLNSVFADIKVIGESEDPEWIAEKLQQMKDPNVESDDVGHRNLESSSKGISDILDFLNIVQDQPWMYATHKFGYIAPRKTGLMEPQTIQHPSAITADDTLKNSRINIRLDRLHIAKYPGGGTHNVMVTFAAINQVADTQEPVSFSQTYRVQEGQSAGIAGYPVFIGLNVGSQGVAFECSTVNVKNNQDQAILTALESSPFQSGLKLLTTTQPAIAPFTEITIGVVKMLAQRNENVAVQKFYLGLDFENAAMGCRLAEGNYIAVQVPDEVAIDWRHWVYDPEMGAIVHRTSSYELPPYNYVIFRVSRYEE